MILMSQNSVIDPRHDAAIDAWYHEHLTNMSSVPGIFSAQRFKTTTPGFPRSIALYSVVSEQAFEHPFYNSIRGFGDAARMIDENDHHVDFFEGLNAAPVVADDEVLLLINSDEPAGISNIHFTWLKCVARDFSTPWRGICVMPANRVPALNARIAVYRPATHRYQPGQPAA